MKNIDWNKVEEVKDFNKLPAGGYVCGITAVEDVPASEYLKLEFDIAEGEYKNYYRSLYDNRGFWAGKFIKSYKEKALGFFKKMLTAFENSNSGFKFDNDEKTLKRKLIGLVIGYEQYLGNDNTVKERITVVDFLPVDDIRAGRYEVPALKPLSDEDYDKAFDRKEEFTDLGGDDDGDLPF
jgi:hypothetical protein